MTCLSVLFWLLYLITGLAYSLLFFYLLSHIIVTPTICFKAINFMLDFVFLLWYSIKALKKQVRLFIWCGQGKRSGVSRVVWPAAYIFCVALG